MRKYSHYISKVDITMRKISSSSSTLLYVSYDIFVYPSRWDEFTIPKDKSISAKDEVEHELRRLAFEVKAYDFSRLSRPSDAGGKFRMMNWLFDDETRTPLTLAPIPAFSPLLGPPGRAVDESCVDVVREDRGLADASSMV